MVKMALSQVSEDGSSGHLIKLNAATLLTRITRGTLTFACSFIVICLS